MKFEIHCSLKTFQLYNSIFVIETLIILSKRMYCAPPFTCRKLLEPEAYNVVGLSIKTVGLPGWLSGKESACKAGDEGSIPGLGRCPGEGKGNPLQYSCLGNLIERGVWQATVHWVAKKVGHDLVTKQQQQQQKHLDCEARIAGLFKQFIFNWMIIVL